MNWLTSLDDRLGMLGTDNVDILDAVEGLCLIHSEDDVLRIDIGSGRCAYCVKYADAWSLVAVAPMGDLWDQEAIPRKEFFSARWPASWVTRRAKFAIAPRQSTAPAVGLSSGDWIGAILPNRQMRLAQVAQVHDDGSPSMVRWAFDSAPVRADIDG